MLKFELAEKFYQKNKSHSLFANMKISFNCIFLCALIKLFKLYKQPNKILNKEFLMREPFFKFQIKIKQL